MQISYRTNPKTVGWARRVAIALLVGSGVFALSLPVSFLLLLSHYNHATPNDPQNMLGALTVSMLVGVGLGLLAVVASLMISFFFGLSRPVPKDTSTLVSQPHPQAE